MRIRRTPRWPSRSLPTSANLGPGFDTLGLALDLCDELSVEATTGSVEIEVQGEGSGNLPEGEDHLVVRALAPVGWTMPERRRPACGCTRSTASPTAEASARALPRPSPVCCSPEG